MGGIGERPFAQEGGLWYHAQDSIRVHLLARCLVIATQVSIQSGWGGTTGLFVSTPSVYALAR